MIRRAISVRCVAVLAYALVLNALVWAGTSAHRWTGAQTSWCSGTTLGLAAGLPDPGTPSAGADAAACDLACAAHATSVPFAVAGASWPARRNQHLDWPNPAILNVETFAPWRARGPPSVV
jgi:hypothetical protein